LADGTVIIIGGAEDKVRDRVILNRFVALAGGSDATIAVISTASSLGVEAGERYRAVFAELGVRKVRPLHTVTRPQANVDGMRQLTDFVGRMMVEPQTKAGRIGAAGNGKRSGRAIAVIGIPGDRRDEDQREYGALAAGAFDEVIVREDKHLRGRQAGETASNVIDGIRAARTTGKVRAARADKILDEMAAVRTALRRAVPGDLVVCCVDDAIGVYREAMSAAGASRGGTAFTDPGELEVPEG